jgi:hypothetical protein
VCVCVGTEQSIEAGKAGDQINMFVFVRMCGCLRVCVLANVCVRVCNYMCVSVCVRTCVYVCLSMCVWVYAFMCVCVCVCVFSRVCVYRGRRRRVSQTGRCRELVTRLRMDDFLWMCCENYPYSIE